MHHNVVVGYLAVLLLALCLNTDARLQVQKSLHPEGLITLVSIVNEFSQYHRKVEEEPIPFAARDEACSFHVRLQDLVSRIQRMEGCI